MDRVAVVADDQRRRLRTSAARSRCGAVRPKNRPCSTAALGLRVLADRVEHDVGQHGSAARAPRARRAATRRITGSPKVSATISGVNAIAQPSSALSSTGISITMPRSRSGASDATSSVTLAPSDVPPTTASSTLEVVEQRDDLLGRTTPSSSATCRGGRSDSPWPSRSSVIDAVAALGQLARQRLVHALGDSSPWQQDHDARPGRSSV